MGPADGSTDSTVTYAESLISRFHERNVGFRIRSGTESGGVGFAKNQAVKMSSGRFISFCDADDVSEPSRLQEQYNLAISQRSDLVFIGSNFTRIPEGSTERYTKWTHDLTNEELKLQVYTSHGPTFIAPTWFISRKLFSAVGGFKDDVRFGFPEDLDFFYRALDIDDVAFSKVCKPLVNYRSLRMCFFWCFRSCYMEHACGICALTFPKKIKRAWLEDYDEKARVVRWKLPIVHVKLRISIERMWQDARDIFAQVREATSEFEDVWMNIAHVYIELGQYVPALQT
ncbi:unnamed protein product [Cylicocyclus nassatus]|uniref:Glycosyltransferase 2-like domain-containing protein n=1 Tax=Cylicocyclus nassatus TaxID=53992 RepID=A0AA36MBC5_CYLNA|nr:unnamed protein product [Cylicocyclus nassatus]